MLATRERLRVRTMSMYPGYVITDDGRIQGPSGRWLKPKGSRYGHKSVQVRGKWISVHVLVALAYIGERPPGHEVAHENGDASDNRVGNLSWKTHADNIKDRERHGHTARGESHGRVKLTRVQVDEIRAQYVGHGVGPGAAGDGPSQRELAKRYGVSEGCVRRIVSRETWA